MSSPADGLFNLYDELKAGQDVVDDILYQWANEGLSKEDATALTKLSKAIDSVQECVLNAINTMDPVTEAEVIP